MSADGAQDSRPVVLSTNDLHPDAIAMLEPAARLVFAPDTQADTLRRLAGDAEGIVVRALMPDDICAHAPRLRGMVRHGVGLDFIPVAQATTHGVMVANLPGSNTQAVAEYCFAQLFALRRPLAATDARLRTDGWNAARALASGFGELGGTTLGILGVGAIGARVAAIAAGFGMKVIGCSRTTARMPATVEAVDIDTLFARADAVILSCALTDETRGIVDAARIGSMQPHAVLVNVSRGAVVDTAALLEALRAGRIAGAALDVHDTHPLPAGDAVYDCPSLLLSPHVAAITVTSYRAMGIGAAEQMLQILRGEEPSHLVNPGYRQHRRTP